MKDTGILPYPAKQPFLELLITSMTSFAFVCCKQNKWLHFAIVLFNSRNIFRNLSVIVFAVLSIYFISLF